MSALASRPSEAPTRAVPQAAQYGDLPAARPADLEAPEGYLEKIRKAARVAFDLDVPLTEEAFARVLPRTECCSPGGWRSDTCRRRRLCAGCIRRWPGSIGC